MSTQGMTFSQTDFEIRTIAAIGNIHSNGRGGHQRRSLRALYAKSRAELKRQGYDDDGASAVIANCRDMAELEMMSEE